MNIILILISVLLNSAAQIFIRKGMLEIGVLDASNFLKNIIPMATNVWLWGAFFSYVISIVLWLAVLSRVQVSFAYPFLSVGYVVVAIFSYYFMGENLSFTRILGIMVICIGVVLISRS